MHQILADLRYALRTFGKSPALTATIVLSLALGIGANTAIFSVANALLLKPLPYPDPDRLAVLWLRSPGIGIPQDWPSPGQYIDILNENHSFQEVSISHGGNRTLTGLDEPVLVDSLQTSSNLFHLLGAKPLLGRLLLPEEDKPGRPPVVILSYAIWQRLFSADPHMVGRAIYLGGNPVTVVGVLQKGFLLNHEVMSTVAGSDHIDIIQPLPLAADAQQRRLDENYNLVARLKPGVTMSQAQADISVIAAHIREKDKRDRSFTISVVPMLDQVVGNVRRALLVLLGSVALVLLIACANVANLLLSRATSREKEVAIRTALGAGRGRLIGQLLTEVVMLSLAGGAGGLLIAQWSLRVVHAINPGNIPRLEAIGIDARVLAFTFAVSLLTGIIFGAAPAFRVANVDLNTSLKTGGRSSQSAGGLSTARHRLRGLLVVSELALSLVLLIGAGLLIRSFVRLQAVPPGFNPDRVISMRVSASGVTYRSDLARVQLFQQIGERIAALPGVEAQGGVTVLPFTSSVGWGGISVEGFAPRPGEELQVDLRDATPGYFHAMQTPLLQGRFFSDHDTLDAPPVVMIDAKFAQRFWPHENPIGKHVWQDPKKPLTIVGVVATVKQYGLDTDGKIVVYFPQSQDAPGWIFLVARTSSDPAGLVGAITREIHAVDRNAPVDDIETMHGRLYDSLARQRFSTTMLAAFAVFALILAVVGVYGVISFLVTQGTHDIGLRIALGAQRRDILGLVVRRGMTLAGAGIALGSIGALALTRLMSSLLFGVSAIDGLTFCAVALLLASTALVASYVPALRATRVDPVVALREE